MEWEYIFIQTEMFTKVNSDKTRDMAQVHVNSRTGRSIKEIGGKINFKAMV